MVGARMPTGTTDGFKAAKNEIQKTGQKPFGGLPELLQSNGGNDMNYTIEPNDPWYIRHGAALGAILVFVILLAIFAWGMMA